MARAREPTAAECAAAPMPWFKHDASASSDVRCRRLIMRHGVAGYGAWWLVCEALAAATGHSLPVETEEDWTILADYLGYGHDGDGLAECRGLVNNLVDIGLLELEDGRLTSRRLLRDALVYGARVAAGFQGGRPCKTSGKSSPSRNGMWIVEA